MSFQARRIGHDVTLVDMSALRPRRRTALLGS
jgi:hypothetical protein